MSEPIYMVRSWATAWEQVRASTPKEAAQEWLYRHPGVFGIRVRNDDGEVWEFVASEAAGLIPKGGAAHP